MKTRTGGFSIGFRRGVGEWQKDLDALLQWMKDVQLEVLDLGRDADQISSTVVNAGVKIGSVDLKNWQGMISPEKTTRDNAVQENTGYIEACAASGPKNHFLVMIPEKADLPRSDNFGYMVESFAQLAPQLEKNDARIVIEGWPGPGALCCTPEGFRELFKQIPSKALGINYDPSHLIRMGIDPIRFLEEFGDRVYHIHGKDTEILSENLYEFGTEQPPTFGKKFAFGSMHWRYTIPGQGCMRWKKAFEILKDRGYSGCVSIELEDANFNGSEETERLGLVQGAEFLTGC